MKKIFCWSGLGHSLILALALTTVPSGTAVGQDMPKTTPTEMVKAYESLADAILAVKSTEEDLIRSILAVTYQHAEGSYRQCLAGIEAGRNVQSQLETLASLVSQLGNEGDAAVAGVRKRLLEGGHHHNAAGEAQGLFDPGFVVVTKAAKKAFLDSATAIGRMGRSPNAASLKSEWAKVEREYSGLAK